MNLDPAPYCRAYLLKIRNGTPTQLLFKIITHQPSEWKLLCTTTGTGSMGQRYCAPVKHGAPNMPAFCDTIKS